MKKSTTVVIDMDAILEIALKGVRRTSVFLGFGIKAAANPDLRDYSLAEIAGVRLVPENVDEKTLGHIREEFSKWIVGSGLRELIESFGLFLDEVFRGCIQIQVTKRILNEEEAEELLKTFIVRYGIKEKLRELSSRFKVCPQNPEYFVTINKARHCLTHRGGIVRSDDITEGKTLALRWKWIEPSIKTRSGKTKKLGFPMRESVLVKEGEKIVARWNERKRRFKENSAIDIPPRDLAEICAYVSLEARNVMASFRAYAERESVPITTKRGRT